MRYKLHYWIGFHILLLMQVYFAKGAKQKSQMCNCVSPSRSSQTKANTADMTELQRGSGCFRIKVVECLHQNPKERLGVIFEVNKGNCYVRGMQIDSVSVIAINNLGYPYGKIMLVDSTMRTCYDASIPTPSMVNDLDPISYTCSGLDPNKTLYNGQNPEWLSVAPKLTSKNSEKPFLLQFALADKIKTSELYPTHIQFILEIYGYYYADNSWLPMKNRLKSENLELKFLSGKGAMDGMVDVASSSRLESDIALSPEYYNREVICKKPLPDTPLPAGFQNWFLCRQIVKGPSPPINKQIESCATVVFNHDASGVFYLSVSVSLSGSSCSNFGVDKLLFTMFVRNNQTTRIEGEWSEPTLADYVAGKCYNANSKKKFQPRVYKDNVKSCDMNTADKKLYLHIKPMSESSIVCSKWKLADGQVFLTDVQPVVAVYFHDGSQSPPKYSYYFMRASPIYEISKPRSSLVVTKLVDESHYWSQLMLSKDPLTEETTPTIIEPPKPWKTYMCGCTDPRRQSSGLPFPTVPIIDLPSPAKDCFELKTTTCSQRPKGTEEQLGVTFVQKRCSLNLRTVDISIIAINENGYPYGKMTVMNQFLRSCYKPTEGNAKSTFGELQLQPVINYLDPIWYKCGGLSNSDTLFDKNDPEWLSVRANFTANSNLKFAIQFGIANRIKTAKNHPQNLQFIVEFSVENAQSPGTGVQYYRLRSEHLKLNFNKNNLVESSDKISVDIKMDPDYLFEGKPIRTCTSPLADTIAPVGQEKWMFCRDMETSSSSRSFDDSIKECLKFAFQYKDRSSPPEFYFTMSIDPNCGNYKVEQLMFQMLARDQTQSQIQGEWEATTKNDFSYGKCYSDSSSHSLNAKKSLPLSIQSCSGNDNKIYFYYKIIKASDFVCGKWKSKEPLVQIPTEIQPVFKVNYLNGKTERTYEGRVPFIYELSSSHVYKNIYQTDPSPGADILLPKDPFLTKEPKLAKPKPRISSMCDCVHPRRSLRKIGFPKTAITDVSTSSLKDCFQLKIVNCNYALTERGELLGVIFIQKYCPGIFNLTTIDISLVAINNLGYAYGRLAVMNKTVRACFTMNEVKSFIQTINYLDPLSYSCSGLSSEDTLFAASNPEWLSVQANLKADNPSDQVAVQVGLLDQIKTGSQPSHLQFIAEFSVEYSSSTSGKKGPIQFYKILSNQIKLNFDKEGYVSAPNSPVVSTKIELDIDYIAEGNPPRTCLSPQADTSPPLNQRDWMFCRNMKEYGESKYVANNAIANCLSVGFNQVSSEFYFSVAISSSPRCANFSIEQMVFTMLTRTRYEVTSIAGNWWKSVPADFTTGRCPGASSTTSSKKSLASSLQSCNTSSPATLHYYYKPIYPNEVVCGKWTTPYHHSLPMEIQPGFRLHYVHESKVYSYTGRSSKVLEKWTSYIEVVDNENPRTDILLLKDPFLPLEPELQRPIARSSVMCDCKSPRRQRPVGPILQDATKVITDLQAKAHLLSSCYKLEFAQCPDTKSEELGALFIQKDCAGAKDLKTIDISLIAFNQNGFPYGELVVFRSALIRNCFNSSVDMTKYKPILHHLDPKQYDCSSYYYKHMDDMMYTGYGTFPHWMSLDAHMTVNSPSVPAVIQFRFKEKIKTNNVPHPTHLQLIAEFSAEYTSGGKTIIEVFRIRSEHIQLVFKKGVVDRSLSPTMSSDISLDVDYTAETPGAQCSSPTQDIVPNKNQRDWLMCRCLKGLGPSPTPSTAPIDKCIVTVFNSNPNNSSEFFFSVQKVTPTGSDPICKTMKILSLIFTTLKRDYYSTTIGNGWSTVNASVNYVKGLCLSSKSIAPKSQMAGKFHKQSCNALDQNSQLFFHYKVMENDGDIICAKWIFTSSYASEIQIAFKVTYENGSAVHEYTTRNPTIYEIRTNPSIKVKLLSNSANDRIELLHPDKFQYKDCIEQPFLPSSDVCDCLSTRHGGFAQNPKDAKSVVTQLTTNLVPVECFDFKMSPCTGDGSEPYDTIGALLIIHGKGTNPSKCNVNVTIQDISFQVLNGEGFPFGELVHSKFLRSCLPASELLNKDYNVKTLDFMNPVSGKCDGRFGTFGQVVPEFQYPNVPNWIAVNAAASLADMSKALVIQIYLKKISGAKATKVQFVAEMAIKHNTTGLFSIKTPVYSVGYTSAGHYDPRALIVATTGGKPDSNIMPNPHFYEQTSKDAFCKMAKSPHPDGVAIPHQHCGCFEFTDPGYATRLLPGTPLHTIFDTCVNFVWNFTDKARGSEKGNKFYLTTWTPTGPPDCQNLTIVGVVLTPLKRKKGTSSNPNSQIGSPHGKFERATLSYAQHCPMDPEYEKSGGRLRRPPEDYFTKCLKPPGTMYFFYYPLTKQRDKGNAFCAPWAFPEEDEALQTRFEFQFAGEFFITDNSVKPPVNYVGLKRTSVFEYFPNKPASRPGVIYEVAAANMHVDNCDTDICLLK